MSFQESDGLRKSKRKFGWAKTDFVGLQVNSCSIDQENGEIWTAQTDLQQIYSKPLSLLDNPGESAYPPGALNQIRYIRL